jgi:ferrochelatase
MVVSSQRVIDLAPDSAQSERVAVLLMGYGEVERYEDFAHYNEQALNLLTAKFAPVPTWLYPPLAKLLAVFDLHEWGHQHGNFISPHNAIFEKQRAGIESHLQKRWGDRVQVFKAFNFCAPFLPEQVLQQIRDEGFQRVLIYPLLVVDSIFTSGIAVEQVNRALAKLNTSSAANHSQWLQGLRYIPSFFDQSDYLDLLATLVRHQIQGEWTDEFAPSQVGIILMNHGCPHKAKGFVSGIAESEALYEQVRARLVNEYPLISIGWLNHDTPLIEWTQPSVFQSAMNLIALGAQSIVLMPIGFATENHETLLDVHHIIHRLEHKHPSVQFRAMGCVNDHPQFLEMAAHWAMPHVEELFAIAKPSAHDHKHGSSEHASHHHDHDGHSHPHHGNGHSHPHPH